jgi:hypothetical protein
LLVIDGLQPVGPVDTHRLLALQPVPSVAIRLQHTVRRLACAFLNLGSGGIGKADYVGDNASLCIICQLIAFEA